MIVAVVALGVVIAALLYDRHRLCADHARDRRELIAAALSGSAREFTASVERPARPKRDDDAVAPRPVVGL